LEQQPIALTTGGFIGAGIADSEDNYDPVTGRYL
jgi:hypothetical protein